MGVVVPLHRQIKPAELPAVGYRLLIYAPDRRVVMEYPVPDPDGGERPFAVFPADQELPGVMSVIRWAYGALRKAESCR